MKNVTLSQPKVVDKIKPALTLPDNRTQDNFIDQYLNVGKLNKCNSIIFLTIN